MTGPIGDVAELVFWSAIFLCFSFPITALPLWIYIGGLWAIPLYLVLWCVAFATDRSFKGMHY